MVYQTTPSTLYSLACCRRIESLPLEGLKNAGKNLTPETMIKGMEKIKNWEPEGIGAPVTYGPDRRHGVNASRMSQARKGRHVPIEKFTIFKPRF